MTYIATLLAALTLSVSVTNAHQPANQFLVPDEPAVEEKVPTSKTALKEKMGDTLEEVMQASAALNKSIGSLQVSVSSIQSQLVGTSRNLLDNAGPVKKAGRKELQESLKVLQETAAQLQAQAQAVSKLEAKIHKTQCLKNG